MTVSLNREQWISYYDSFHRDKCNFAFLVSVKDGGVSGVHEVPNTTKLPPCKRWEQIKQRGVTKG